MPALNICNLFQQNHPLYLRFLVVTGICTLTLITGCNNNNPRSGTVAKTVENAPPDIKLVDLDLTPGIISLNGQAIFSFTNPNADTIKITKINCGLFYGGHRVAVGRGSAKLTLLSGESGTASVPVDISAWQGMRAVTTDPKSLPYIETKITYVDANGQKIMHTINVNADNVRF